MCSAPFGSGREGRVLACHPSGAFYGASVGPFPSGSARPLTPAPAPPWGGQPQSFGGVALIALH